MRNALDDIAALMASFFIGHDFVLSDIVSGLLLVVHSPHTVVNESKVFSTRPQMPLWMKLPENLATVSRFLDLATAVYGWPSYMFNNLGCMPWIRLFRRLQCCRTCRGEELVSIESDNCCSCHTSAFILESALEHTDLAFVSFRNKLYLTPFVVLTDHQTHSIVITIRGSASIMDLITDLSLNSELFSVDVDTDPILRLDTTLDDGEVRVHRGMLNAARYVYNTLKANGVLEDLLVLNPEYQIVVCGHSLGAGIGALLTLLLKQQYPNIRCYSFSPPGCVVSKNGIQEMENHVLSIIVGDDLVPRISYQSMYRLKKKIDREVYSTSKAKYEILIKGFFKLFFSSHWELHDTASTDTETRDSHCLIEDGHNNRTSYGTSDDPPPLEEDEVDENEKNEVVTDTFRVQLYPPGRLAHFSCIDDNIELRWIEPEFLSDIQLTGSIVADHFPYRMRKVIKKATDEHSLNLTSVVVNDSL
jgi:sn1-specific diacylglycerol lipase